jgi:hypothetical protein
MTKVIIWPIHYIKNTLKFWLGNLMGRQNFGDPDINGGEGTHCSKELRAKWRDSKTSGEKVN